jgi:hypothetical protein
MYDTFSIYGKQPLSSVFYKKFKDSSFSGNSNLELPFKIHIVLDGIGVFVKIETENTFIGPCDGCGIFEDITGFKVGNPLNFVSGHSSLAFQLFFIIPADDDRFNGFHRVE